MVAGGERNHGAASPPPEQPVGEGEAQLLAARGKLGLVGLWCVRWQVPSDSVEAELAGCRLPGDQRVGLTLPWPELSQIVLDVTLLVIRVFRIGQVVRRLLLRGPEIVDPG